MAHVEMRYRCPTCNTAYNDHKDAIKCRNRHPIREETWAVGKDGKEVRFFEALPAGACYSKEWSLKEADLSDLIEVRERQLKELKAKEVLG